jgi:hypothetical protein
MSLGARRMGKGHTSAGGWPWAARGADAEAGRRDVAERRRLGLDVLLVPCLTAFLSKILY